MAYKVIILYRLYMPSYFLGTFTEYPYSKFLPDFIYSLKALLELIFTSLPAISFVPPEYAGTSLTDKP